MKLISFIFVSFIHILCFLPVVSLVYVPLKKTTLFPLGSVANWTLIYGAQISIKSNLPYTVINLDLEQTSSDTIRFFRSQGKKVICYFSAGSYENWRTDRNLFLSSDLGKNLDGWPGERWLDIRSNNIKNIMYKRISVAASKGCNAVDPDNVDGYTQNTGFQLTYKDQLIFNRYIANTAHAFNLSVGLKNDLDQIKDLVNYFDFAMNEQCWQYKECNQLNPFISQNKTVFNIEYSKRIFTKYCSASKQLKFNSVLSDLDVTGKVINC